MKIPTRPIRPDNTLLTVFLASVVSVALASTLQVHVNQDNFHQDQACNITSAVRHQDEKQLFIAPADFSFTHQQGRQENVERICCSSLQMSKIIRSSIFDAAQQAVLSQRLAWFTRPAYFRTLSAIWHPSIPIAHRKLVI